MGWRQERLFLLGYSFKVGCLQSVPDCLSGDSGRDDGINEFGGLGSISSLPTENMMNKRSSVMWSELGRTT